MSVESLLSVNLSIPDYQRPYKWSIKNITDLLVDTENAINEGEKYSSFRYRVGTIILHYNEKTSSFDIVDGQQRCISFLLLKLYLKPDMSDCSLLNTNFSHPDMTFNYTDTIERVYHIQNVFHPHGGIPSCSKVNPIMGHGNKYLIDSYRRKAIQAQSESVEWYESICNAIADFCNSMYKDVEGIIERNQDFFKRIEDVDRIMVLGVSFGDVDIPYLERIKSAVKPETKWYIYYYGDESKRRLKEVFGILGISSRFETYFLPCDRFWDR